MTTLTERLDRLPPARRKKVEERARALIAEEMSLRDLRKALKADAGARGKGTRDQSGKRIPY